jgi:hypothetical protein
VNGNKGKDLLLHDLFQSAIFILTIEGKKVKKTLFFMQKFRKM